MLNISQVILVRTDSNLCRKELMVHWSAPNSLIRSYLQHCANSMLGGWKRSCGSHYLIISDCGCPKGGSFLSRSSHNSPMTCLLVMKRRKPKLWPSSLRICCPYWRSSYQRSEISATNPPDLRWYVLYSEETDGSDIGTCSSGSQKRFPVVICELCSIRRAVVRQKTLS